ncbi:putative type II restriction endonuclease [uncultured Candidatus Thioglobus sp.]|nr:putative type II restriction endonuclease [uncultured Candidatus Thioglobus sp.]
MTYSEAIEKVMIDNGGFASLQFIYKNIEKYRNKTGLTPDNTIQERVQRDDRFVRIGLGVYALSDFIAEVEKDNLGSFLFKKDTEIKFKANQPTEKMVISKTRIGQEKFKQALIKEVGKVCPITQIDNSRLLIAGHIKPWSHSNNSEKLNPKNGILLSPLFDKLFDMRVGLITFTADKRIRLSKKLEKNANRLGIVDGQIINNLKIDGREEFLQYHEKFIFQR